MYLFIHTFYTYLSNPPEVLFDLSYVYPDWQESVRKSQEPFSECILIQALNELEINAASPASPCENAADPVLGVFMLGLALVLAVLLSIAFFTVFERKVLAAVQGRKGPNFVGFLGILQAIADGFKLFLKEATLPSRSSKFLFIFSPILMFFLGLCGWIVVPINGISVVNMDMALIFLFMISSLNVYSILGAGWSSNSRYAFLGSLRAAAQVISYEIIMGVSFLSVVLISGSLNLVDVVESQWDMPFVIPLFPFFLLFFIAILAETNRVPFDLPEAESELVSGYNVEYSGFMFTLFFLAEYSTIILFSNVIVLLYFGGWNGFFGFYFLKLAFVMFLFVLIRGVLPRYRYDQLMVLGWMVLMPIAFGFFFFYNSLYLFFNA